jgi:CheY-like chemotaxis protein
MRPAKPIEVLLVEDNAGDILMVKQAVAGERYPVSIRLAVDGQQAIDMLARHQFEPDLVILDLALPRLDGLTVLEQSRTDAPVVVFSSSTSPAEIKRSFELGVRDFIPKPLGLDEYTRAVTYIVRKWGGRNAGGDDTQRYD